MQIFSPSKRTSLLPLFIILVILQIEPELFELLDTVGHHIFICILFFDDNREKVIHANEMLTKIITPFSKKKRCAKSSELVIRKNIMFGKILCTKIIQTDRHRDIHANETKFRETVISFIKRCVYFINYVFCVFSVCFLSGELVESKNFI